MALTLCLLLVSCSKPAKDEEPTKNESQGSTINFTNLVDQESKDTLKKTLLENGLNEDNVVSVLNSVKEYNDTIGADLLNQEGTISLSNPIPQYNSTKMDENWLNKYDVFIGYNCRITAFQLMKNLITINDTESSNPTALFMDEDAIDNSPNSIFSDEDYAKFEALYSTILTDSSTDSNAQYEVQKKYWEKIGVKFNTNDNVSLISVYLHNHFSEEENELIIGHTGVLVKTDDGYLFFEKLSFQLPYQMIMFSSKEQLKSYLMATYDTDTTGESSKPFILENDKLM